MLVDDHYYSRPFVYDGNHCTVLEEVVIMVLQVLPVPLEHMTLLRVSMPHNSDVPGEKGDVLTNFEFDDAPAVKCLSDPSSLQEQPYRAHSARVDGCPGHCRISSQCL